MSTPMSQKSLRPPAHAQANLEVREIYILVMGLTGAGKGTFISVATENSEIPVGEPSDMEGITQEVGDYILNYRQGRIMYEVHLIDSPGFDDAVLLESEVLLKIATYVNTTYKLKQTLAGVIYIHDITQQRMRASGLRNLRTLENMIESAEGRERKLKENHDYFGAMLASSHQASMMRFDPKSKGKALEIIKPHLTKRFDPQISFQMVDPKGPKLELGETDAGKVVADNIEKLEKSEDNLRKIKVSHAILAQRFNEKYFEKFKTKRDELVRKQRLHKATRWTVRTVIVGGSIAATVVTLGPGASAFALEPAFETIANRKKREDKDNMEKLKKQYKEESAIYKDYGEYSADWLDDRTVKQMSDLESSTYSIRSRSSEELEYVETGYVDTAETVAEDLAGFAIKDS